MVMVSPKEICGAKGMRFGSWDKSCWCAWLSLRPLAEKASQFLELLTSFGHTN